MLSALNIKNYALIKNLKFEPQKGLNTITGETGAGKSILLGALGLITGKRADTNVLLDKTSKCIVEAHFNISEYDLKPFFESTDLDYEAETIVRREISPAGKSRAFVNDTPVNLAILTQLGSFLIDVHSQNETIQLNSQKYQTEILDGLTDSFGELKTYKAQYKVVNKLKKELNAIVESAEKEKSELDYHSFLLTELTEIDLDAIDGEKLETEIKAIENFSEIKSDLGNLINLLEDSEYSISKNLSEALQLSKNLTKLSPNLASIEERLNSLLFEQEDLAKEITATADNLDIDTDSIEDKIALFDSIQNLYRKHHVDTTEALLIIKQDLEQKTSYASNIDANIDKLKAELEKENAKLLALANKLHLSRSKNNASICKQIEAICTELGMPNTKFDIKHEELDELTNNGLYNIKFMFSANKGISTEELSKVASGGEFSRLMFAIKSILATKTHLPTIIFDEIDTGISGEIALKMGILMQKMSIEHQLICITHLPQIASKGENHYFVYKDNSGKTTSSNIRLLEQSERKIKIAEMIAGENPGETALRSAEELLG